MTEAITTKNLYSTSPRVFINHAPGNMKDAGSAIRGSKLSPRLAATVAASPAVDISDVEMTKN